MISMMRFRRDVSLGAIDARMQRAARAFWLSHCSRHLVRPRIGFVGQAMTAIH